MNKLINEINVRVAYIVMAFVFVMAAMIAPNVSAEERFGFSVAPMKQKIVLNPGESYSSTFYVANPANESTDIKYDLFVTGFYVDENYNSTFGEMSDREKIAEWITINSPKDGVLSPNERSEISYTINVPRDASGGGQYAAIMVTAEPADSKSGDDPENKDDTGTAIKEEKKIAYSIYAEITGDITRQGEIKDVNVPSFLLSGDITAGASIRNTGNVHGEATYKLQVFPLFSNEEIFTNEEDPYTATILPDRTRYEEISWDKTPEIGIFNVVYTVEFEGVTEQVSKMVIKCPIWLLFIILFIIAAIIIWIITRIRARGNAKARRSADRAE